MLALTRSVAFALSCGLLLAVDDPGQAIKGWANQITNGRLELHFEARQRAEDRTGIFFGRERDIAADYVRVRFGATVKLKPWLKFVGFVQDTRAPFYGAPAPGNVRNPLDIQQAYIEAFAPNKRGFGLTAGRLTINLGDTRLIGSPQWAYVARTWDTVRLYHVSPRARLEVLMLATGVPRGNGLDKPVLGDRIFGTYNTFDKIFGRHTVDAYFLRHAQNRPGGFTGSGTLGINLVGTRWAFSLPDNVRVTAEGIAQNGHVGEAAHRAFAFATQAGHRTSVKARPLDLATEYKYASGTNPGSGRSGTFDPLYPGVHDKFGHVDLFGWKNIHNIRSTATLTTRPGWNWVLMYNNSWLDNPADAAYSTAGRVIARSLTGKDGRHLGQELDLYTNITIRGGFAIGAGVGQFFPGGFIRNTTPAAHSRLIYLSTAYSF